MANGGAVYPLIFLPAVVLEKGHYP